MDAEIKLGCLKLAADINRPSGNYDATSIVETATVLYNFCQASPQAEKPAEIADKPRPGRKPKTVDILS